MIRADSKVPPVMCETFKDSKSEAKIDFCYDISEQTGQDCELNEHGKPNPLCNKCKVLFAYPRICHLLGHTGLLETEKLHRST